jgi:WD40 repeat protein
MMLRALFTTVLVFTWVLAPQVRAQSPDSAPSPETIRSAPAGTAATNAVAFSPDGIRLASGSNDGTVRVWDVATGTLRRTLSGFDALDRAYGGATEVAFSPDGQYLAGLQAYPTGRMIVWQTADGTEAFRVDRPRRMYDLFWRAEGRVLYASEEDGAVYTWSLSDGTVAARRALNDRAIENMGGVPPLVGISTERKALVVADLESGTVRERFDQISTVNQIAFVPGRPLVAVADGDGDLKVWDLETGALHFSRFAHADIAYFVSASPDGEVLATVGEDNYIRLWDTETGALIRAIQGG